MSKQKIMIVEDEVLIAMTICEDLKKLEYDVMPPVHKSENAIQQAQIEKPDLILMDIKIKGGMDGIDTAKVIRETLDIPVIYLTAFATEQLIARAKLTEPFGYLVKPVETKELHSTIQMALYKFKMEKERKELLAQLQEARDNIEALEKIIPICSFCKKIRDDKGYWEQLEKFMGDKYFATFSHGVCPGCMKEHYPEVGDDD